MNGIIQKHLASGKRRIERRLDKRNFDGACPVFSASNVHYETAERVRAVAAGGIGVIHTTVTRLGLDAAINRAVPLLKVYRPYSESDHVLNIAYNVAAGGTCLDHLELRRNDEVYLDALGAARIPDPTTAGDFCRRFDPASIHRLMDVFNQTRLKVWREQPEEFFEQAVIDADGSMVETAGESKQGADFNHKAQYGYHPLIVSLANTGEPLFIVNRSGNRPSHEGAAGYLDQAVALCRQAGFRQIRLRGDTDFSQTARLDGWEERGVKFVFGLDARDNLYELAEYLPLAAWKRLQRSEREIKTEPRRRPENVKGQIVEAREYANIRLVAEHVAEFDYQPAACSQPYRVVVVWKELEDCQGQAKLFDYDRCFFYITNDRKMTPEEIVFDANDRCDQENLIQQLKGGVYALTAPLGDLNSNWAYMVTASLAWSLKAWSALLLPVAPRWREKHVGQQRRLLRMDFSTYRNAFINMPAQIVRTGRKIVYRLLSWNPWQGAFFRLFDCLKATDYG